MEQNVNDQEVLENLVKAMVDNPDDVQVERDVDEMGVLLTLHVNDEDMGTLIGRQGRTAQALRTVLRVVGAKNNARVNLKLAEPEGSSRTQSESSSKAGQKSEEGADDVDELDL